MRYARITHTYLLPVPEDQLEGIDAVLNSGVSAMERVIMGRARNIRELRSEFELVGENEPTITLEGDPDADLTFSPGHVPRRYEGGPASTPEDREQDSILSKRIIEADLDGRISFTGDVMGQRPVAIHPWDQGLLIFPFDHPLHELEEGYFNRYLSSGRDKVILETFDGRVKELESGG